LLLLDLRDMGASPEPRGPALMKPGMYIPAEKIHFLLAPPEIRGML
jgi:hypothetical protein